MRSLRLRILLLIAAVSAVTLAGVGLFSSRTTTLELERFAPPSALPDTSAMVAALRSSFERDRSWSGAAALLQEYSRRWDRRIVLVGMRGGMIAASEPALGSMTATIDRGGALHLRGSSQAQAQSEIVLQGAAGTVLDRRGSAVAYLYVLPAEGPNPGVSVAAGAARSIWIAVAIAMVADALAAWLLSSRILRPVDALTRAAQRLARGELNARVVPSSDDEIGSLARSFNAMADALSRLERARKEMVADLAHELRTPLTHIRARLEAMQDGRIAPSVDVFAAMEADVLLLQRLLGDLQDLSLADAGKLRLSPRVISVESVVQAVADRNGTVPIDVRTDGELPPVVADPERVRQVLRNLLDNAVAHAAPGSRITIELGVDERAVAVSVRNEGEPLHEAELGAIFDRFYRTGTARTSGAGGAGLGLAIVKQLVEASGGNVWARSTTEPDGVAVTFTLPSAAGPER